MINFFRILAAEWRLSCVNESLEYELQQLQITEKKVKKLQADKSNAQTKLNRAVVLAETEANVRKFRRF